MRVPRVQFKLQGRFFLYERGPSTRQLFRDKEGKIFRGIHSSRHGPLPSLSSPFSIACFSPARPSGNFGESRTRKPKSRIMKQPRADFPVISPSVGSDSGWADFSRSIFRGSLTAFYLLLKVNFLQ